MEKILWTKTGLSKYNDGDECFIQCFYSSCFAEHEYELVADRVRICKILKEQSIIGKVTWD